MFNLFAGFVGASLFVRVSTLGIREGWWPFGNVRVGGRHIHHYVPGILIAFGAGAAGLITESREPRDGARGAVRRRGRPDLRRGGAAARLSRRLLEPRGHPQRPGHPRRSPRSSAAMILGMRMLSAARSAPPTRAGSRETDNSDRILRFASGPVGRRAGGDGMTYVLTPAMGWAPLSRLGPKSGRAGACDRGVIDRGRPVRSASLECPGDDLARGDRRRDQRHAGAVDEVGVAEGASRTTASARAPGESRPTSSRRRARAPPSVAAASASSARHPHVADGERDAERHRGRVAGAGVACWSRARRVAPASIARRASG